MTIVLLVIAVILNIILFVVGLFIGNILMFESIGLGILAGVLANNYFGLHPALCLLLGIATVFLFIFIACTKFGFWIIAILMSIGFALVITACFYEAVDRDQIWAYVIFGLSTVFILGLHMKFKPA